MKRQPIVSDRWDYKWGVVLKGVEGVWRATGDARYADYIKRNVDHFVSATGEIATYRPADHNIDHINPHSKGGKSRLENAALICRKHNSAKGNRRRRG